MNNAEAWAPYLNNPLTLAAFIAMLAGFVFLGVLKLKGAGSKLVTAIAGVFIFGAVAALLLATVREYQSHYEPSARKPGSAETQTHELKLENTGSTNIQMVQGSNNVLINKSESGK